MPRYITLLLAVFVTAIFLAGATYYVLEHRIFPLHHVAGNTALTSADTESSRAWYKLVRVVKGPALEKFTLQGVTEPLNQAVVTAQSDGVVAEVLVSPGVRVGARVPLAIIEHADIKKNIAGHKASVRLRHQEYLEARALHRSGKMDNERYAHYLGEYERALSEGRELEAELENRIIRSPTEGTVLWQEVEAGQRVETGSRAFGIGNPYPLRVSVLLTESQMTDVTENPKVLVEIGEGGELLYEGKIQGGFEARGNEGGSYAVKVLLPKVPGLAPGMRAAVHIISAQNNDAILVPETAVVEGSGGAAVYLAKKLPGSGYKLYMTPVSVAPAGEYSLQVTDSLIENDLILGNPSQALKEGMVINGEKSGIKLDSLQRAVASNNVVAYNKKSGGGCGCGGGDSTGDKPAGGRPSCLPPEDRKPSGQ